MIISVASGKGGTGKTMVATSLALSLDSENVQFLDCDVEEPNGYIFLKPEIKKEFKIYLPRPKIDIKKCTFCGKCASVCVYNAIAIIKPEERRKGNVLFFYQLCHNCGACRLACPENAIYEEPEEKGELTIGTVNSKMFFAQGKLRPSESSPVPLIKALKKYIKSDKMNILDASPGTSCPVVQTVKNTDFCLLVTESTPFGLNDLNLAVKMVRKLGVKTAVVINRSDIGDSEVEKYCLRNKIPVLLHIPFKREIAVGYSNGIPLVSLFPEYKQVFKKLFHDICDIVEGKKA